MRACVCLSGLDIALGGCLSAPTACCPAHRAHRPDDARLPVLCTVHCCANVAIVVYRLQEERKRSDALLYQMIPRHVADKLRRGQRAPAESHEEVSQLRRGGGQQGARAADRHVEPARCACRMDGRVFRARSALLPLVWYVVASCLQDLPRTW